MAESQKRFFGLDINKEYFVSVAVNKDLETVFGPQRVSTHQLEAWTVRVIVN